MNVTSCLCCAAKKARENCKDLKVKTQGHPAITIVDYDEPETNRDAQRIWRRLLTVVVATNGMRKVVYYNMSKHNTSLPTCSL